MIPKTSRNKQITWTVCVCVREREIERENAERQICHFVVCSPALLAILKFQVLCDSLSLLIFRWNRGVGVLWSFDSSCGSGPWLLRRRRELSSIADSELALSLQYSALEGLDNSIRREQVSAATWDPFITAPDPHISSKWSKAQKMELLLLLLPPTKYSVLVLMQSITPWRRGTLRQW